MSSVRVLTVAMALLMAMPVFADDDPEPIGRWRYRKADRKVKVVVIGGSIAAWGKGSFSHFLAHVCRNTEVKNLAKTGYGAFALKRRFRQKFLRNWNVKLKNPDFEYWLLYSGGLNSIYTPEMTIKHTVQTFVKAHKRGVRVVALTLTPWGSEKDKRWRGWSGVDYGDKTRKAVDYIMGRLARNTALGRYAPDERDVAAWKPGELPTIGIDVYDSALRHKEAPLRETQRLVRKYSRSSKLKTLYPDPDVALKRAV